MLGLEMSMSQGFSRSTLPGARVLERWPQLGRQMPLSAELPRRAMRDRIQVSHVPQQRPVRGEEVRVHEGIHRAILRDQHSSDPEEGTESAVRGIRHRAAVHSSLRRHSAGAVVPVLQIVRAAAEATRAIERHQPGEGLDDRRRLEQHLRAREERAEGEGDREERHQCEIETNRRASVTCLNVCFLLLLSRSLNSAPSGRTNSDRCK